MARLLVTDSEHGTQAPFLRGILTRSLQESGLDFDQAYQLASDVRQELFATLRAGDEPAQLMVSSRQIEAAVIRRLRRDRIEATLDRYRSRRDSSPPVTVLSRSGHTSAFSRAHHQRVLESCGLASDEAAIITQRLYQHLLEEERPVVRSLEIDQLTHDYLANGLGPPVAKRYLVWRDFVQSGRPLILLIGGTAGCGKSTTATGIANRLEIVRTQSTDMLREVMRMMLPERLLPVLHASSFEAWQKIPWADSAQAEEEERLADGFRAQADLIAVACEAVVQRAIRERVSLILEGVHVQPSLLDRIPADSDALVVPVMLAVLNSSTLRGRIRGRGVNTPARRSERYLRSFDGIWRLQSHLLAEADRAGIPIISNTDEQQVFLEIMRLILERLSAEFSGTPEDVFQRSPAIGDQAVSS